jgi:HD-GYP domain-containing protein (c-di-GMP phosphodiesterase class II)
METQKIMEMLAEMKADQATMVAKLDDNKKKAEAFQEKMEATIQSIRSEVQETIHNRVENVRAELNQKTEANTEKFEQDPGMMQSVEEHQDVPTEDVALMPVGEPRKRRRVRKLAAGRRGEPKQGTRGYYTLIKRRDNFTYFHSHQTQNLLHKVPNRIWHGMQTPALVSVSLGKLTRSHLSAEHTYFCIINNRERTENKALKL